MNLKGPLAPAFGLREGVQGPGMAGMGVRYLLHIIGIADRVWDLVAFARHCWVLSPHPYRGASLPAPSGVRHR